MARTHDMHHFVSVGNSMAVSARERVIKANGHLVTSDIQHSRGHQSGDQSHGTQNSKPKKKKVA